MGVSIPQLGAGRTAAGYGAALLSAIGYAAGAVVAAQVVANHASPITTSAFSLAFGAVIVGVPFIGHVRRDASGAPLRAWVMVGMAGVAASLGVTFFFLAIATAPLIVATPVTGAYPLVAIVLSYLFINSMERVTWRTWLGGLLVVGGVVSVALG